MAACGSALEMAADDAIFVRVAEDMSSLQWHADRVSSAQAGAVATFSGVTRDSFEGKTVVRLEYEAYVPMAEAKLRQIAEECVKRGALKCAISHKVRVQLLSAGRLARLGRPRHRCSLVQSRWCSCARCSHGSRATRARPLAARAAARLIPSTPLAAPPSWGSCPSQRHPSSSH